jgi:ribonuclease BN (tRNA processing enzyme)
MKLVLLGTAGYHPNDRRQTACLMLPELGVVFDAGTGMFRVRDLICTPTLDIFLSHTHLDHVVGLTYLLDVLYQRPMERVSVHAAADKLTTIETHLLSEGLFPVKLPCDYQAISGPVTLLGGAKVTAFPLAHPGGALGFRLEVGGRSLAYVTDTTASDEADYLDAVRGVDVLVHECNFPDSLAELAKITGHSCMTPVAKLARAAGVGQLVLVHLNPLDDSEEFLGVAAARQIFAAIDVGFDGREIEF